MKPFLLLQQRPENAASDNEYETFVRFCGLSPQQLVRMRIEDGILDPINLSNYAAILLGGGPYNITEPESKKSSSQKKFEKSFAKLMEQIIDEDFPFLVACAVGVAANQAGGVMSRKYAEKLDAFEMNLTKEGRKDPLTAILPRRFEAYAGHKEACEVLPPNSVNLVKSDGCPYQLFRIKKNIYVSQFHPEFDALGLTIRIETYKNHGYFPPETADTLSKRLGGLDITEPTKILRNFTKIYAK